MQVTRLMRGYRIRLSDREFRALEELVDRGAGELALLTEAELEALDMPDRFFEFQCLRVDEDRRRAPVAKQVDAQR